MTIVEAARRAKVLEQSAGNWKRQFLEGGKQGLADGGRPGSNPQDQRLEAEIEELKAALGEARVELRVWKKSAEYRLGLRGVRDDPARGWHEHGPIHAPGRGA